MEKYDITDYLKDDKELQKAVIDEFLKEIAELKAENEALIEGLGIANKYVNKYHKTLQEIKAIVCGNYEIIDSQGRKDILKLITKAESEG